jgi:hypothetical protein
MRKMAANPSWAPSLSYLPSPGGVPVGRHGLNVHVPRPLVLVQHQPERPQQLDHGVGGPRAPALLRPAHKLLVVVGAVASAAAAAAAQCRRSDPTSWRRQRRRLEGER